MFKEKIFQKLTLRNWCLRRIISKYIDQSAARATRNIRLIFNVVILAIVKGDHKERILNITLAKKVEISRAVLKGSGVDLR